MIEHEKDALNPVNPLMRNLLRNALDRIQTDGLNNLNTTILSTIFRPLYVYITVDIGKRKV